MWWVKNEYTISMEKRPTWEADSHVAGQEITQVHQ